MMDSKVNYTLVGLFVLLLSTALIAMTWWLSANPDNKSYRNYILYFNESVSGLNLKAPVKFNGVEVGYVKNIQLHTHNITQVELLVAIERNIPITTSTRATIQMQGITGIAYIGLKVGNPDAPLLVAKKPHHYPVIPTEHSLLFRLDTAMRQITTNLDSLTQSMGTLFDKNNVDAIHKSLVNTATLSKTLADNAKSIDHILKNSEHLSTNVAKMSNDLPQVSHQVVTLSTHLTHSLQHGDAILQNLSEQTLPIAVNNLEQLQQLLATTQDILQKVKQNPALLIRGERTTQKGPGE